MFLRNQTRQIKVGRLLVGGGAPVSVQTMANVDPHDARALIAQVRNCAEMGCEIYRLTVPDVSAAKTLEEVKRSSPIPLVADVHFDYRCALAAIAAGVDALRINPGNIGSRDRIEAVVRAAKAKHVPIRIGVNLGSLEKGLPRTVDSLVKSALTHLEILEREHFYEVVISVKVSKVADTLAAYRRLAEKTDCPLHLGVTEAGTLVPGTVRSSVALGILLAEGLGDTIRVSLTDRPEQEVKVGLEILRSLGLKAPGPSITSCPTCGRTRVPVFRVAAEVEEALEKLYLERVRANGGQAVTFPRVAVMGCAVNGPGEAKDAEVALCGGDGEFIIYVRGEFAAKVTLENAVTEVMKHVQALS